MPDALFDPAFAGNHLLARASTADRILLESSATLVDLRAEQRLLQPREPVSAALFPFEGSLVALIIDLENGRSVQAASIGREGAIGGIVSCGNAPAFSRAEVIVPGPAMRVSLEAVEAAKNHSPFIADLFCRYSDFLLAQVMQSVACNAFHTIQQRTARWLLAARARSGDRMELTQDALARLLGVQRTSLNAAIQALEDDGLVESRRGKLRIVDLPGLHARSCECYGALERHFNQLFAEDE